MTTVNKVALEEHFGIAGMEYPNETINAPAFDDVRRLLTETEDLRLESMDKSGIQLSILSFHGPGIQAETDPAQAVEHAKRANDFLQESVIARHPDRYAGFTAVPMQNPEAAADELERCVTQYGFKGAMVNGFSNIHDENTGEYLDEPQFDVFWAKVAELDVPSICTRVTRSRARRGFMTDALS